VVINAKYTLDDTIKMNITAHKNTVKKNISHPASDEQITEEE